MNENVTGVRTVAKALRRAKLDVPGEFFDIKLLYVHDFL
jgi:hypothetical protein